MIFHDTYQACFQDLSIFLMAEFLGEHGENYTRKSSIESNGRAHRKCQERLSKACRSSAYVKFMLDAMSKLGCMSWNHMLTDNKYHFCCLQMFLCENTIYSQRTMEDVLTHELIHAYDNCRIKYNPDDVRMLACTEIRAANLSGDCWFSKETFGRFKFGWKGHQQKCVKERAVKSILCVREISKQEAEDVVESVFDACFHDTDPFERIPP
ncbi:Mitochondrial inner membrane protease ATP23-like protein [Acropora cervicornis]|uniref:Mitochondrial inner membrane protease ATP23 n=1 Tax=Acropora cervicornis TaxID=6130 RepID=A0AAD9PVH6_ACRCE|nr:Mitochondrial inner membrane protease ATP23-like protein [Acropora cervicornis]